MAALSQQGAGAVNASNWTALLAPKATPQPIIDKLSAEKWARNLNMADVKVALCRRRVSTIPSTPADLDAKIKRGTGDSTAGHRQRTTFGRRLI